MTSNKMHDVMRDVFVEVDYCCEKMQQHVEHPESVFNRSTTFVLSDGKLYTDFSQGEYGDIEVTFCPFCGKKFEVRQQQ